MDKSPEAAKATRRDFLKVATTALPAAAAAATLAPEAAEAATDKAGGARVQDTPHTRAYYASARF